MNIRNAKLDDIIPMQHCNLICIPENYKIKYYFYILLTWPQLSFVAENDKGNCVGYVLGKMGEGKENQQGTITSLAVNRRYRQCGLARKLMNLSFQSMVDCFQADCVFLHVRKSNHVAFHLYSTLDFKVQYIEPKYYADGEDAYTMRKTLSGVKEVQKQDKNFVLQHKIFKFKNRAGE